MATNVDKYFAYEHLPAHLQPVSKIFADALAELEALVPDGPEKSAGARLLLQAKDCYVRAKLG